MFRYKYNLNPNGGRVLHKWTITDAQTLTVGDAVYLVSGKLSLCTASHNPVGIVAGFVKADGSPLTDNGASGDFVDTYTAPSSNTVKAIVDISTTSVYSVTMDATLGTTTGSNLPGYNADVVAASDQLDESSTLSTTAQFFIVDLDNDPSAADNSVLVTIQESQFKI